MSDPTSLAASFTDILAIGRHLTDAIKQITSDTPSAPTDFHFLGAELELLCGVLEKVQVISQGSTLHTPVLESHVLVQILDAVRGDFEDLQEIVGNRKLGPSDGVLGQSWNQSRWVLWEPEVADIQRCFEVYKASLLLVLSVAERTDSTGGAGATEDAVAELDEIWKDITDVRAQCEQLTSRPGSHRLVSCHRRRDSGHMASREGLSPITTTNSIASETTAAPIPSSRSTSIRSSPTYRSASTINTYFTELERQSLLSSPGSHSVSSHTAAPATTKIPTHPPTSPSPAAASSRLAPPLHIPSNPNPWPMTWRFPFPQPTRTTCTPMIMPVPVNTANDRYHFFDTLFYPAPELTPGAFSPVPSFHATAEIKDDYVRACVERNTDFVIAETLKLRGDGTAFGEDLKRSLGIMKRFWRCHALFRIDPGCYECLVFWSAVLPRVSGAVLRIYGFGVQNGAAVVAAFVAARGAAVRRGLAKGKAAVRGG